MMSDVTANHDSITAAVKKANEEMAAQLDSYKRTKKCLLVVVTEDRLHQRVETINDAYQICIQDDRIMIKSPSGNYLLHEHEYIRSVDLR